MTNHSFQREHAQSLQSQLDQEMETSTEKQRKEVGPLREQLQVQGQTRGYTATVRTRINTDTYDYT